MKHVFEGIFIIWVQCRANNDLQQRECKIVNKTGNAYISGVTNDSVENSMRNKCVSTTESFIKVPLSDCANDQ